MSGDLNLIFRSLITDRCGGADFDAPGGGYAFSDILDEERSLAKKNIPGDPKSALLTLSIADPTWKMPSMAIDTLVEYYGKYGYSTRYTDNSGAKFISLTGEVVDTQDVLAGTEHLNIPSRDWVQYSPGSIKRLLSEYIPTLLFDSDTVLIFPTPGYPVIKSDMNKREATVVDVPMQFVSGKWEFDFGEMARQADLLSNKSSKKFVYMSVPNNPTAIAFNEVEWEAALIWAERNNIYLIIDEAYDATRYRDTVSALTVPGWEERCIVLQSISKGWNATGARFGWVVAHPTLIKGFRKVIDVKDSGGFGPLIAAALSCLEHPEFSKITRRKYYHLHKSLCDGLIDVGFDTQMPDGGLCQLTLAPKSIDGCAFKNVIECAQYFREKLRISLMHYEVDGKNCLRWATTLQPIPECGLQDEESIIVEAVRRMKEHRFEF